MPQLFWLKMPPKRSNAVGAHAAHSPPAVLAPGIVAVIDSAFDDVNEGRSTLQLLHARCPWLAEYVGSRFTCLREDVDWRSIGPSLRTEYFEEEINRELNGDYSSDEESSGV